MFLLIKSHHYNVQEKTGYKVVVKQKMILLQKLITNI